MSQPNTPFQEYLANSPDGKSVLPVFGDLFLDEPIPTKGFLTTADLNKPGFGLTLNPVARAKLIPSAYLLTLPPAASLTPAVGKSDVTGAEETEPAPAPGVTEEKREKSEGVVDGLVAKVQELTSP